MRKPWQTNHRQFPLNDVRADMLALSEYDVRTAVACADKHVISAIRSVVENQRMRLYRSNNRPLVVGARRVVQFNRPIENNIRTILYDQAPPYFFQLYVSNFVTCNPFPPQYRPCTSTP